jgi:flagellar hook-length control protein FliK
VVNPSNHDTTTLRTQWNATPTSEIRLSEAANSARAAENIRTAVENPMLRPELVRQFNEIITRAQVLVTDTQNAQFSVKLFPREIGRMEIDLKLVDGEIRGKIVVESEDVKNEMQNFLQNREQGGNAEQFDMNKIDIEVRSGNQNAQNPQQAPDTQELLQNLVTQSASAAYTAIESTTGQGNALYA